LRLTAAAAAAAAVLFRGGGQQLRKSDCHMTAESRAQH
jgi:hypothetical protein